MTRKVPTADRRRWKPVLLPSVWMWSDFTSPVLFIGPILYRLFYWSLVIFFVFAEEKSSFTVVSLFQENILPAVNFWETSALVCQIPGWVSVSWCFSMWTVFRRLLLVSSSKAVMSLPHTVSQRALLHSTRRPSDNLGPSRMNEQRQDSPRHIFSFLP